MKQLIYIAIVLPMEAVNLADVELVVKICSHTVLAGLAVLTYFHNTKNKNKQ